MSRILARLCLLVAAVAMVLALAPTAQAQVPGEDLNFDGASDVSLDRDPIGNGVHFVVPDMEPNPDGDTGADNVGGTGGGAAETELALTGSEVEPILAVSLGLLALGGSVLVTSRRRLLALD